MCTLFSKGKIEHKKFKEFCKFMLNLLIKISYNNIPDLKKFDPGFISYGQKKIAVPPILAKIIGVF